MRAVETTRAVCIVRCNLGYWLHRYQYGLIPENIVHLCIARLMDNEAAPVARNMEAVCELFATVRLCRAGTTAATV